MNFVWPFSLTLDARRTRVVGARSEAEGVCGRDGLRPESEIGFLLCRSSGCIVSRALPSSKRLQDRLRLHFAKDGRAA
ncbi:hypothetical protein SDJN03_23744, partial [Cucurbita argyrosperma subsp. sororia]